MLPPKQITTLTVHTSQGTQGKGGHQGTVSSTHWEGPHLCCGDRDVGTWVVALVQGVELLPEPLPRGRSHASISNTVTLGSPATSSSVTLTHYPGFCWRCACSCPRPGSPRKPSAAWYWALPGPHGADTLAA